MAQLVEELRCKPEGRRNFQGQCAFILNESDAAIKSVDGSRDKSCLMTQITFETA